MEDNEGSQILFLYVYIKWWDLGPGNVNLQFDNLCLYPSFPLLVAMYTIDAYMYVYMLHTNG